MHKHRLSNQSMGQRQKIGLSFALLILILTGWFYQEMQKTCVEFLDPKGIPHVLSCSVKDKKRLFSFFYRLFAEDVFAYPLLGSKPLAWCSYHISEGLFSQSHYEQSLERGWKTWLKYQKNFPNVCFWHETDSRYGKWASILLVNPGALDLVVMENRKDFEKILEHPVKNGADLLKEAKGKSLIGDVLHGHQALIGIVLGYGRENSWEFAKRAAVHQRLCCVWDQENRVTEEIRMRAVPESFEERLAWLSCPSFAGYPDSEESIALKTQYLETRDKVVNYYKDKDFLEATLSLLAGFRPDTNSQQ